MKKAFKLFLVILVLTVIGFGFYLYKLHALAVEGNKIFEQRCLIVNPLLIDYKNSFLKFTDYLKNPKKYSVDEVNGFLDDYIAGMRSYVVEENKWLETQKKYMNRWDFQLIEPWYIKKAADYQWKMYEGYRDDAKYMLETFDVGGATEEISAKFTEARDRRNEYSRLYYDFFDEASAINDWRKIFGSVSVPEGCTEENIIIPDTSGSIDWEGESATPSPTLVPFDPYSAT